MKIRDKRYFVLALLTTLTTVLSFHTALNTPRGVYYRVLYLITGLCWSIVTLDFFHRGFRRISKETGTS